VLKLLIPVHIVTVAVTVGTAWTFPILHRHWVYLGILALCAWIHLELSGRIERARERVSGASPYHDLKTVWNVAALLLLPPILATGLIVATHTYGFLRIFRRGEQLPHRWAYSCSTVVLASQVAAVVLMFGSAGYPGMPVRQYEWAVIVAAVALRWLVNYLLVIVVGGLMQPLTTFKEAFGRISEQSLEAAAALLAIVTTVLLTSPYAITVAAVLVIVLVLQRTGTYYHLERERGVDAATGLYMRMSWREKAQLILDRAKFTGDKVGLLGLDIDHFKSINDTYGHPVGDKVLVHFAKVMTHEIRDDKDLPGRVGGEEFAILLLGIDSDALAETAERIRQRIRSSPFVFMDEGQPRSITVTASIGATLYPRPEENQYDGDLQALIKRADDLMYVAKQTGRDKVCRDGDENRQPDNRPIGLRSADRPRIHGV
jgi:diguanylate cyclase (GGDEF)-like protein